MSNQENMNSRSEVELTTKRIVENLKKVKATTVNYDYYHNGTPGSKPKAFLGYDGSENRQAAEDRDPEHRPEDKAE